MGRQLALAGLRGRDGFLGGALFRLSGDDPAFVKRALCGGQLLRKLFVAPCLPGLTLPNANRWLWSAARLLRVVTVTSRAELPPAFSISTRAITARPGTSTFGSNTIPAVTTFAGVGPVTIAWAEAVSNPTTRVTS